MGRVDLFFWVSLFQSIPRLYRLLFCWLVVIFLRLPGSLALACEGVDVVMYPFSGLLGFLCSVTHMSTLFFFGK